MTRTALLWAAAAAALAARPVSAATADQVDAAIDRGKAYLYGQQHPNGLWEQRPTRPTDADIQPSLGDTELGQWGGQTALCVDALLAAGESYQDARLAKSIHFLETADLPGTYAVGMRAQLWPMLPPSKDTRRLAAADADRFRKAMQTKADFKGLFNYMLSGQGYGHVDHSVSQYGVLGMWACSRAGVDVPRAFWQTVEDAWVRDQDPDGSWSYERHPTAAVPTSAAMVAAGVATLYVTQDYVHANDGQRCTGGNVVSPHIEAGLKWLGTHFDQALTESQSGGAPYYTMYGISRIGVASGYKYIGPADWYARGADALLGRQRPDGSWHVDQWPDGDDATAFALLFLSRGHAPVVVNKLKYAHADGKEAHWNERPRDVANAVRFVGKQIERELNWQIVDLAGPEADLDDAPVLYLSGNLPPNLSPEAEDRLRRYCQGGGMILANADCGAANFAEGVRKLGQRLFPGDDFRDLPANHPIYTGQQYPKSKWKQQPIVRGLSNGVRELIVLIPTLDPARHWQANEARADDPSFPLVDDVLLYAIDKTGLLEKGRTFHVTPDPATAATRTLAVARLQYPGNWDPEPGGWTRLAAVLHNADKVQLTVTAVPLGGGQLDPAKFAVAHLTGTAAVKLDAKSLAELKSFVAGGGTLLVDAAGGSASFANSAEADLAAALGPTAGAELHRPLSPDAPVYAGPAGPIATFGYRPFARANLVGTNHAPLMSAATVDGRPAVYYSRVDLSAGLVGEPVDGVIGYDPATATAIVRHVLLSAMK